MSNLEDTYKKDIDPAKIKVIRSHMEKADILSWRRKKEKMEKMVEEEVQPLEDEILALILKKQPLMDELLALRSVMVETCIHPEDLLVEYDDGTMFCNFCNKRLKIHV
jgi:hypothetical protein